MAPTSICFAAVTTTCRDACGHRWCCPLCADPRACWHRPLYHNLSNRRGIQLPLHRCIELAVEPGCCMAIGKPGCGPYSDRAVTRSYLSSVQEAQNLQSLRRTGYEFRAGVSLHDVAQSRGCLPPACQGYSMYAQIKYPSTCPAASQEQVEKSRAVEC